MQRRVVVHQPTSSRPPSVAASPQRAVGELRTEARLVGKAPRPVGNWTHLSARRVAVKGIYTRITGIRGPFSCGKRPLGSCLMASSAPGTLVSGAALDFALCVVDAAPHQAVDRSVPLSSASLCASARCLWAGPRTRRCMEASKLMLPASVLQGLPRASDGCCGFNLRCVLPAASPHARWRRSSARSVVSAASCWKRSAHDFGA